ncbi:MAG: type VI secretion system protein TssA [Planctomycetes bacterium]|nr:type VI secretion system protein TssA [Planctomycetota bacterium]
MSTLDIDGLMQEVSPEDPCGVDLVYDPVFGELERAAQGKPEQQMGETFIPPQPPDWSEVKRIAMDLTSRTKDLRVVVYLTRALLNTDGLAGFCDGMNLLRLLLEKHWDGVHPMLDPEDDNDPTMRVNTMISLCDAMTTLKNLQELPLVESRAMGRFSLRDIMTAKGKWEAPASGEGNALPALSTIEAAFLDCAPEGLQGTEKGIHKTIEHAEAVDALFDERVGAELKPDFSPLLAVLKEMKYVLADQMGRRGLGETGGGEAKNVPGAGQEETAAVNIDAPPADAPPVRQPTVSAPGEIRSREDAIRALDGVCAFFKKTEPSSPVPLLLERAKRLVAQDFLSIMRDLAPDGLSQVETISGIRSEE